MLYLVGEFDAHNDRLDTGDHTLFLIKAKEKYVQNAFVDRNDVNWIKNILNMSSLSILIKKRILEASLLLICPNAYSIVLFLA